MPIESYVLLLIIQFIQQNGEIKVNKKGFRPFLLPLSYFTFMLHKSNRGRGCWKFTETIHAHSNKSPQSDPWTLFSISLLIALICLLLLNHIIFDLYQSSFFVILWVCHNRWKYKYAECQHLPLCIF